MSRTPLQLPVCVVPRRANPRDMIENEWLVTNGIGGYSSGTVAGVATRRYHGILVAALPNPVGRIVMLNVLDDGLAPESLIDFRLDGGIPTWTYELGDANDTRAGGAERPRVTIQKRLVMPHRQNTVIIEYRAAGGETGMATELRLVPAVHFRPYEASVSEPLREDYDFARAGDCYTMTSPGLPALTMRILGTHGEPDFRVAPSRREQLLYALEEARGYQAHGSLWSPGEFVVAVADGESVVFMASTEDRDIMDAVAGSDGADAFALEYERKRRILSTVAAPAAATDAAGAQLVLAADQFVIKPVGRVRDTARATAIGDEVRTVIAGYHWFTDWGRDTMISLEGLALATGRHREAAFILRTFAHYVRYGLIPNLFPDGSDEGLYHTADATLWFFHALDRYTEVTGDTSVVEGVIPVLRGIVDAHRRGTRFGIGVDPADGLLLQGEAHYQLTWMDAKVDGWVVTPRRGKAVEINALWHNALCLLARWECDLGNADRSRAVSDEASRVRESFNRRFWSDQLGHLYDVVDGERGDDPACRPNQLLAISLPNPVLEEQRWDAVLRVVQERLVTPVGLRSLSRDHPDYKSRYFGDLRARDAAYHQGTVWAWLIGPWIDAWIKVHPEDRREARQYLDGLIAHLPDFGIGSIAEIFDAEPPFTPRGCIAQAWSVAEVLRCLVKTAE